VARSIGNNGAASKIRVTDEAEIGLSIEERLCHSRASTLFIACYLFREN
jgi:hypothetical protein